MASIATWFLNKIASPKLYAHASMDKHTLTDTCTHPTFPGCNLHQSEARDVLFSGGKQAAKIWSGEALSQSFEGNDERCSRELMTCQPTQWDVMHFKHTESS